MLFYSFAYVIASWIHFERLRRHPYGYILFVSRMGLQACRRTHRISAALSHNPRQTGVRILSFGTIYLIHAEGVVVVVSTIYADEVGTNNALGI
jgi:hypothetical protein